MEAMSSRERVLTALDHREPDRVPLYNTITPELADALAMHLGVERYTFADSPLSQNRISFHELLVRCGNDVVGVGACAPEGAETRDLGNGIYVDEWRITSKKVGYYAEQVEYPLADAKTVDDVRDFPFPDPDAAGRFDLAERVVDEYGRDYAICGDLECTVFEQSWHMVGMEKFLLDLTTEEAYVFELLDRIQAYSTGVGKRLAELGVDFIWLGDDMGTQRGMLISPEMWRTHFKERMRTVVNDIRSVDPNVKFAYHSCGAYFPIIGDLIEVGIDVLNALQPNAYGMDLERIKSLYGSSVSLFGGLDVQDVIPFGTLEEVEEETRRVIRTAAPGGGLLLAGAHNYQPDVSVEKFLRIYDVAKTEGRYPIASG